jgi:hypothetical protein
MSTYATVSLKTQDPTETVMPHSAQDQLVSELARDLVTDTAPQELPLFRPLSEAYLSDPEGTLKGQAGRDETLGFGLAEAATFLTPIVLAVITDVVKYLSAHILQTVKEESSELASEAVKSLFKKYRPTNQEERKAPRPLAPEQIARVRRLAFDKARQLEMSSAQANLLADSVAGSLACAS